MGITMWKWSVVLWLLFCAAGPVQLLGGYKVSGERVLPETIRFGTSVIG